jgi:hypothetical protein
MMQLTTTTASPTSRRIPIDYRNEERIALAEQEMNREAIMADYVDLCFATRLVNGMQKKQSFTHDVSLRYENQALIDHIIATRQNREGQQELLFGSRRNSVRIPPRSNSNDKLKRPSHPYQQEEEQEDYDSIREEDDDTMIFDMEL